MWLATLLLSLRSIRRNLLRSFLTVLGIVIGVAAVITMVTLGKGATRAVQAQISSLGTNLLMVRPGQRQGFGGGAAAAPAFKAADAQAIASQIGGIAAVAPEGRTAALVVGNGRNWQTTVVGSSSAFLPSTAPRYRTSGDHGSASDGPSTRSKFAPATPFSRSPPTRSRRPSPRCWATPTCCAAAWGATG